jgi:hypothetical protein
MADRSRRIVSKRIAWLAGGLLAAAALLGCATAKHAGSEAARELNPFSSTEARVNAISQLGPYLLVELRGPGADLELFTPASEACARVLKPEAAVSYAKYGIFGRFTRGDESCTPVGVASLEAWRDRTYRPRGRVVPRAQVQFTPLFESKQLVLLRGRFPLAGRIGIPAGYDLVAMVANDAVCRPVIDRGVASMEYRDAGNLPYALVGDRALCPVLGFANPPDAPPPSE